MSAAWVALFVCFLPLQQIKAQNQPAKFQKLQPFNAIAVGGPIETRILLNQSEGIRFEGDKDAIATLVSEVKGTALIIRPEMSWTSWRHKYKDKKIVAYVSARRLNSITLSGDGQLFSDGLIAQESITITNSGSGNMRLKLDVQSATIVMSGSGKLELDGSAAQTRLTLSGSGILGKTSDFDTSNLKAIMSGSGKVYLTCNGNIDATISGSATIHNHGSADVSQKVILGTGGVIQQ